MKYIVKISLILIYIGIFILINNSYSTFIVGSETPVLQQCYNAANNYKRNTQTLLNLYNALKISNNYTGQLKSNVKNVKLKNIDGVTNITTNQRNSSMNYKDIYLTNLKIKSILISGVIAIVILILIFLTKGELISKHVLIILMTILIVIIILINLFYGFSFNRNNMYLSEYNFPKPNENIASMSKLKYLERRSKCNKNPINLEQNNKEHPQVAIDINQYLTKSNNCNLK